MRSSDEQGQCPCKRGPTEAPTPPAMWGHRRQPSVNQEEGPQTRNLLACCVPAAPGDEDRPPGPERPDVWTHVCACSAAQLNSAQVTSLI